MKCMTKLTPFTLSLLLTSSLLIPSINIQAGNPIVFQNSTKHRYNKENVIVIKKPAGRHFIPSRSGRVVSTVPRTRHYRGTRIVRPYGRPYLGYGFFYADDEAYKWLAFTSITLKILDNVNEEQQRMHEAAQVRATTSEVGETIIWEDGNASGSIKTTRIGTSTSGRQCREFQQTVTIGGKMEQAYGTACQQSDGVWEIVQ